MRPLTAVLTAGRGAFVLKGVPRMHERPIGDLVTGLSQLGARVIYLERYGYPPLRIEASGLPGGTTRISGATSSQFLSALLIAAPLARAPVAVEITDRLVSEPYVEMTLALMARYGVRNAFMPPTALKLMRQLGGGRRPGVAPRSIGSGGETLGEELLDWGRAAFGVTINEFYGQTECNLVVANTASLFPVRAGSMGRAVAGHRVGIVDDRGSPLPPGENGNIAIARPDPVMFLQYWRNPEATSDKFAGDWLLTGDLGRQDADGYFWFQGRSDDVITSAGYRIGPGEIEDCLMKHPAVALAAAVGVPDALRTEVVKAFLVLKPGHSGTPALAGEIQEFVKTRLAAHEYPRLVEFVDALPLTATGKIIRRELRQRG
jgi:acetyl-CoA synthetase